MRGCASIAIMLLVAACFSEPQTVSTQGDAGTSSSTSSGPTGGPTTAMTSPSGPGPGTATPPETSDSLSDSISTTVADTDSGPGEELLFDFHESACARPPGALLLEYAVGQTVPTQFGCGAQCEGCGFNVLAGAVMLESGAELERVLELSPPIAALGTPTVISMRTGVDLGLDGTERLRFAVDCLPGNAGAVVRYGAFRLTGGGRVELHPDGAQHGCGEPTRIEDVPIAAFGDESVGIHVDRTADASLPLAIIAAEIYRGGP